MTLSRLVLTGVCLTVLSAVSGCATFSSTAATQTQTDQANTLYVPGNNDEDLWERTVDVVHNYFEIARENKLDGVIETQPKTGASLFEPWHRDSVGFGNRAESTLQSIRRRAVVSIRRNEGGYLVSVQVFKELEDLPGLAANSPGAATFQTSNPLQRDLNQVVGQSSPSGWMIVGRDAALERDFIAALHREFSRS